MRSCNLPSVFAFALIAIMVVVFLPTAALAAEEHGENSPIDSFGIKRYDLGIWTLVVFALLLAVLKKYAWPHIAEGLEKREASIRGARDEAKQDRVAAAAMLADAKRQLDEAAIKVKDMLDDARKAADAMKASEKEAAAREIEAKKQQAEREIAAYRDAQEKELDYKAVQLATLMAEKALRREVTIADHTRLLDESLAELRAANKA